MIIPPPQLGEGDIGIQVQAAAGRTQQEDLSGAFLQMANEANQNVKIRNLRRFAWLIEALGGALVGLQYLSGTINGMPRDVPKSSENPGSVGFRLLCAFWSSLW